MNIRIMPLRFSREAPLLSSIRIGSWTAHPEHNQLVRGKEQVKLEPRIMQVLVFLAHHAGEVVSRERILEAVWKDVVVSDEVLTNAIREIRKALGDDARVPQFIQTIPKQGYRLIAPVSKDEALGLAQRGRVLVGLGVLAGVAIAVAMHFWLSESERPPPQIRPLTTSVEHERYPSLSPDGKQVAFSWNRNGNWDLYVKLIDGGEPLQLTQSDRHEVSPVWSPDGNRIAFLRETGEGSDIVVIPALGGAERILGTTSTIRLVGLTWSPGLDWSPDGRWLATADKESTSEGAGIFLFSTESGERQRRTTPPRAQNRRDKEPIFSPNGDHLAYVRCFGISGYEIRLHSLNEGTEQLITTVEGLVTDVAWSPDGAALVYATELDGQARLWRVNISSRKTELMAVGENAEHFSVARSGGRLAYATRGSRNCNIWRVAGPAAEDRSPSPERVITSTVLEWWPACSPDGSQIAFTSRRSGAAGIWVCDREGTNCYQLADHGAQPRWSPDGASIAYAWKGNLNVVQVKDGLTRPLTSDSYWNSCPVGHVTVDGCISVPVAPVGSRCGRYLEEAGRRCKSPAVAACTRKKWRMDVSSIFSKRSPRATPSAISLIMSGRHRPMGAWRHLFLKRRCIRARLSTGRASFFFFVWSRKAVVLYTCSIPKAVQSATSSTSIREFGVSAWTSPPTAGGFCSRAVLRPRVIFFSSRIGRGAYPAFAWSLRPNASTTFSIVANSGFPSGESAL